MVVMTVLIETTKGAVPAAATLVNMVGHNLAQTMPEC